MMAAVQTGGAKFRARVRLDGSALGCIVPRLRAAALRAKCELNRHPVRADDLEHPDELRVDLDPGPGASWDDVRRVALIVRDVTSISPPGVIDEPVACWLVIPGSPPGDSSALRGPLPHERQSRASTTSGSAR